MKQIKFYLTVVFLVLFSSLSFASNVNLTISASNGVVLRSSQGPYQAGDQVTLTVIADDSYMFTGWSGDITSRSNPLTVILDTDKSLVANFALGTQMNVHSWDNAGVSNINIMPNFYWRTSTSQSYIDNVEIPLIDRLLSLKPEGQKVLRLSGEIDDINIGGQLEDLIITSTPVQTRKTVYRDFFRKLHDRNVQIDMIVLNMESYFDIPGLMQLGATCDTISDIIDGYYSQFRGVLRDSRTTDPSLFLDPTLEARYPVTSSSKPYNCNPWQGSDPSAPYIDSHNAWQKWANTISKEVYDEAIIGPLHEYYPNAKVSQYQNVFPNPIPDTINGHSYNPTDWPYIVPIGDVTSPSLYYINYGQRYSSGFRHTTKKDPWNVFIDYMNILRMALGESQHEVVPWFGYPTLAWDYTAVNPKLYDLIVAHVGQLGITDAMMWNPASVGIWKNQAIESSQYASEVFATTPVSSSVSRNLPMIPFDANSVTTGNVTTTYQDFLNLYDSTFPITISSTTGGSVAVDGIEIQTNPQTTNMEGFKWFTLTPLPASGQTFYGWAGDLSGTALYSYNVLSNKPLNIRASFGPVAIGKQPTSATVSKDGSVSFTVKAVGKGTLIYQWKKDGVNIDGVLNPSALTNKLTLTSLAVADSANYTVEITNEYGTVASDPATLTVTQVPVITDHPYNLTTIPGQPISFYVAAIGPGPLSYQWKKNGVNISDERGYGLTILSPTTSDEATYSVVVSNAYGSVESNSVTLAVHVPPSITTQPSSISVTENNQLTLNVVATGASPLLYQWKKNGICIPGANEASYSVANSQLSDAGSYTVVVANPYAQQTSSTAVVTINTPPTITSQPVDLDVAVGDPASFSVTATGTAPLTYQWKKDGVDIPGAVNTSLEIANTTKNDEGIYTVVVSNMAGSITSNLVNLIINTPPSIITQPLGQTINQGDPVTLSVVANGTEPFSYQWKKNGMNILGAISSSFSINLTNTTDQGFYTVLVSNKVGNVESSTAVLIINSPPGIEESPKSVTVENGQPAIFSVVPIGTEPFTYQWMKDGLAISGAVGSTYNIASCSSSDQGSYRVVIKNYLGTITSDSAELQVTSSGGSGNINTPPSVNAGVDQTILVNEIVNLNAVVSDDGNPNPPGELTLLWSLVSGPGAVVFSNKNSTNTKASFSNIGEYVLKLTASDGSLSSSSGIKIIVASEGVVIPSTFTLTTSSANGSITKTPNESSYSIGSIVMLKATPNPGYKFVSWSGDVSGTNEMISVLMDKNKSAIANFISLNQAPNVYAGKNQLITLPSVALLKGIVSDDGLPYPPSNITTQWTMVSGPGVVVFDNANNVSTSAYFSKPGSYILQLSANDGMYQATSLVTIDVESGAKYSLTVTSTNGKVLKGPLQESYDAQTQVVLNAVANRGYHFTGWSGDLSGSTNPIRITMDGDKTIVANFEVKKKKNGTFKVNAGNNQNINLDDTLNLSGQLIGDSLEGITTTWVKDQGPGDVIFANPAALQTTAKFTKEGVYRLTLMASDNGVNLKDTIRIQVNPKPITYTVNINAFHGVVEKNPDLAQYKPGDRIYLTAQANEGYQFESFSGDLNSSANPTTLIVDGDKNIIANFRLKEVDADNVAPIVNAGADQVVTLPLKAILKGYSTKDGQEYLPAKAFWCKLVGPGNVSYANSQSLITTATFSKPGEYVLLLTVVDENNNSSNDRINISVKAQQ